MSFDNPWTRKSSQLQYENNWIRVREDQVVRPDGIDGIYGVVEFKNKAIGIVPIDSDGNIHLVGQFRYVLNEYSWEIPEGGCPAEEDPLAAAKRELMEETGLTAKNWSYLGHAHLSNSVSDELAIYYLATDLTHGEAQPDSTEKLMHKVVPFAEAVEMVLKNEITDSLSVIAILTHALMRQAGQEAFPVSHPDSPSSVV